MQSFDKRGSRENFEDTKDSEDEFTTDEVTEISGAYLTVMASLANYNMR